MAGRSALWFWVPPCCFPPPPCDFLALITNLVQFEGQNCGGKQCKYTTSRVERLLLWAHVIQRVVVVMFQEPIQMACFWRPNTCFCFACRSVSYYSVLQSYLARFTSKRKRNTLKGFVIRSSRKKQFVQQPEMPKKAMSAKRANRSFLFSSKAQEWNSFTALIVRRSLHKLLL